MSSVSIIIPVFNEAERLGHTLDELATLTARLKRRYEVVVVDDGSTDGSADVARARIAALPGLGVIQELVHRGRGHAVRTGMLAAKGDVRVTCDANGAMPADELPKLIGAVRSGADVAIGARFVVGPTPPLLERTFATLARRLSSARWVPGVTDVHTGYKAFSATAAEKLFARAKLDGWAFDVEVLGLARQWNLRITELTVEYEGGRSTVPLHDLPRLVREALALDQVLYPRAHAPSDR